MTLLVNVVLGLFPTLALAWVIAADARANPEERVVADERDSHAQRRIFLLIYALWAPTLAMWNWMRSVTSLVVAFWLVAACVSAALYFLERRKTA